MTKLTRTCSFDVPAPRVAVRCSKHCKEPIAVFSYLVEIHDSQEAVLGRAILYVPVSARGKALPEEAAQKILTDSASPGEVDWKDIKKYFGSGFSGLQKTAQAHVRELAEKRRASICESRHVQAEVLRADAEHYTRDRLKEIEVEEARAKALEEETEQLSLGLRTVTGFKARKEAVRDYYNERIRQLEAFEDIPAPGDPQPLGIILGVPL